ncbi:hypothetical protein LTR85_003424 [Meristemomyces frigidus]|nr:hypothetical protein LTR85_003424 [Meristemomyces frigidus]
MRSMPLPHEGFGRTLMPDIIDSLANKDANRPFALIAKGATVGDGYRAVTVGQLATAINRAAWWIEEQFGKTQCGFPTVAYMGPQDLRYTFLMLGAVKAGYKLFTPSPRNTTQAHLSLLDAYRCTAFVLPGGPVFRGLLKETLQAREMQSPDVPNLDFFLNDGGTTPVYPWSVPFEQGRLQPMVALQTSGSTGIPKPVIMTQASMTATEAYKRLPSLGHAAICMSHWASKTALCAFPFFHAAGLAIPLMGLIYGFPVVLPPPGPLSAPLVAELIETHDIQVGVLPPSIIVDMSVDATIAGSLRKLEYIYFGGGPLPKDVGDRVAKMTHLVVGFGTSETGMLANELLDREDWMYLKFPELAGIHMRPYADNLCELVFVRDPALEDYQAVFTTFPEMQEYSTKDLFSEHPTKRGLWRFRGRSDDIIVYSTGEKFNPATMEDAVNGHPAVKAALVCGSFRFQSALLVEPASYPGDEAADEALVSSLWPVIEGVNRESQGYARVMRDMILIAKSDRPFPRAGKGTVQRRLAVDSYESELDALYAAIEDPRATRVIGSLGDDGSSMDLAQALRKAMVRLGGFDNVTLDDNLFDRGMDSLGVVNLLRSIRSLSPQFGVKREVNAKEIYQCKSLNGLAVSLLAPANNSRPAVDVMQELYEHYTSDLPVTARPAAPRPTTGKTVLLTGSTGSLGTYLLDALLRDRSVAEVVCLNRSANAEARQSDSMGVRGLCTDFTAKPIWFLQADLSKPYFGFKLEVYQQLLHQVSHIMHNAWQVDFNVSLEHMSRTHIHGVRQLIDFSARSKYAAFIFFVSSIGAVQRWSNCKRDDASTEVPEAIVEDWAAAGGVGYTQSKLVAERMLATAAAKAGTPCAICRVGQIAGPTSSKGMWPKREWLPSLLLSSKYLGCLPLSLGPLEAVDWIPVDTLSKILLEFADAAAERCDGALVVYHAVNPNKTTWAVLLALLQDRMHLPAKPFQKWVKMLSASNPDELHRNPALKLLDFFITMTEASSAGTAQVQLCTAHSRSASVTLDSMDAVDSDWMGKWLQQWDL